MTVATERGFPVAWLPEATVHRLRGHQSSDLRTADLRAQVQSLSLTPPGLPPEAVLCVRQLTVPLQGRLNRDPAAWQTAALDQLSALHRRAVRPLWEPVPPATEAVLFDHPADLLSGLALAWRRGGLQRWWWAGLCTPAQLANPAVLWLAAPQWLPRMLATLALHSEAGAFVEALGTAQAEALLRAVLDCFGLGASLVPISAGLINCFFYCRYCGRVHKRGDLGGGSIPCAATATAAPRATNQSLSRREVEIRLSQAWAP